ncbi:MAG: class I SAM-dependent methyltransferase [Desulfitobacteriaceae bacterium]
MFDDFLAFHLLFEEERTFFVQQYMKMVEYYFPDMSFPEQANALALFIQTCTATPDIISRARYTEDNLEEAVKQGVQQYVILGSGLDTFAFRHPDMVEKLQVFEVDHPATQAFKLDRIAE